MIYDSLRIEERQNMVCLRTCPLELSNLVDNDDNDPIDVFSVLISNLIYITFNVLQTQTQNSNCVAVKVSMRTRSLRHAEHIIATIS